MAALLLVPLAATAANKKKQAAPAPVDVYAAEAAARATAQGGTNATPGSAWYPGAQLSDLARDLRASQVDDLVTVVVSESASAVTTGTTKTSRASTAAYSVNALAGPKSAGGALANLLSTNGSQTLDGEGTTTRQNTLTTTISARVTRVLPNGYLVLEGTKRIVVNSESQVVTIRGVARPFDIGTSNLLSSSNLAEVEILINGKGVVGDVIKRPFSLYRILLGLLPF
jgi:flagellar L-ring protein precursor FlgH